MSLEQQIVETPLRRRVVTQNEFNRPCSVYCFIHEVPSAIKWFWRINHRFPDKLIVIRKFRFFDQFFPRLKHHAGHSSIIYGARQRYKAKYLTSSGIACFFYWLDPGFSQVRTDKTFFDVNRVALERLWGRLEDEESQLVLASVIRHRTTGDHGYLRMSAYPEYAHPIVKAQVGDCIIDGGAFDGKTSVMFSREVGRTGLVYAFEPSYKNRIRIILRRCLPWNWKLSIQVAPFALSSTIGQSYLENSRGGSCRLVGENNCIDTGSVKLTTIDRFTGVDCKVDLISLDIEGAEPDAINGAHLVIEAQRPKLQISIYHEMSHLFKIPLDFLDKYEDYALFIGHHDVYSTETDAYLIPREQLR